MRENKLYASLKKCIFVARKMPLMNLSSKKYGVRPDPVEIKTISERAVLAGVVGLRKILGLSAYLHKYSRN